MGKEIKEVKDTKITKETKAAKGVKGTKESKGDKLAQLIKKHKDFAMNESGKIHCSLTSHEMTTLKEFEQYLKGRVYRRAQEANFDIGDYSQHLKPYRNDKGYLFCGVTGQKVANKKTAVDRHVEGKRYKRALERIQKEEAKLEQQAKLKEEKILTRRNLRKAHREKMEKKEGEIPEEEEKAEVDQKEQLAKEPSVPRVKKIKKAKKTETSK